jgi:hypothetical protein
MPRVYLVAMKDLIHRWVIPQKIGHNTILYQIPDRDREVVVESQEFQESQDH